MGECHVCEGPLDALGAQACGECGQTYGPCCAGGDGLCIERHLELRA